MPVETAKPTIPATQNVSVNTDPQLPDGRGGFKKVGKPYQIAGRWYTPSHLATGYDQTGTASWYGRDFHGKYTANGEMYDMHTLSAAHKTLPLPTLVRVTNLDNGRSIIVRVNDRGPFVKNRLIDLSYAAARELAYDIRGTARVRVQTLDVVESLQKAATKPAGKPVAIHTSALAESVTTPIILQADTAITRSGMFIQLGAYGDRQNALRQQALLSPRFPQTHLVEALVNGRTLYKLRIGPFRQPQQLEHTMLTLQQGGYTNTMVITQ
ncbi:MAG: septal ring lytic transglycosylase RlpA family protein [Mariprofundus sp.]